MYYESNFPQLLSTVNFDHHPNPVTLSPSGPGIAGNFFSLMCSARLVDPIPLPSNVPSPSFEWLFGLEGNTSLPSGVTSTGTVTVMESGYVYSSTLLFSPALNKSHAGMYTCRLGAGQLANSTVVSVDGMLLEACCQQLNNGYSLIPSWYCPNHLQQNSTDAKWTHTYMQGFCN